MSKKTPKEKSDDNGPSTDSSISGGGKSLVFISHDSRDADLAEAFANLLSDVSAGTLKSFRSSDKKGTSGIEFGTEWYKAIMSQLGGATDVVALLTHRSIDRPWILYEAGVAKGRLDTTVLGLALGVPLERVSTGPFGQFQNCGDDEDSLTKLVMQLLRRNPEAAPREEAVRRQVIAFREATEKFVKQGGSHTAKPPTVDESTAAKLFEEVKAMVQVLPDRVDDRIRSASGRTKHRRMHPAMIDEFLHHPVFRSDLESGISTGWLVLISYFRQDLPWVYELGMEVYRAVRSGSAKAIEDAKRAMMHAIEIADRSPIVFEFLGQEGEDSIFFLRHLVRATRHELKRIPHRGKQAPKPHSEDEPS